MLFLILLFTIGEACSTANKIKCGALAAGCGATCLCDFPVCECCPLCLACIVASGADCCECLFGGWSGCSDHKMIAFVKNQSKKLGENGCYLNGQLYSCGILWGGQECCNGRWHTCPYGKICPYCPCYK